MTYRARPGGLVGALAARRGRAGALLGDFFAVGFFAVGFFARGARGDAMRSKAAARSEGGWPGSGHVRE